MGFEQWTPVVEVTTLPSEPLPLPKVFNLLQSEPVCLIVCGFSAKLRSRKNGLRVQKNAQYRTGFKLKPLDHEGFAQPFGL